MFSIDQSQCSILTRETYMTVSKMAKHSAAYHLEVSSCGCLLQKYYGVLGTNTVKWHNQKILWYFMKQRKWSLTTDVKMRKRKYTRSPSNYYMYIWSNKSLFPVNGWPSCSNELMFRVTKSFERVGVSSKRVTKSLKRVGVSSKWVTKSFEQVSVSSKWVNKSFERVGVSIERVTKSFERVGVSSERVTKSFKWMQVFFKRL